MSFPIYLNVENLFLIIATNEANKMFNELNSTVLPNFLDENKIIHNLEYGFIAYSMIIAFLESAMNTIIRDCAVSLDNRDKILRYNIDEKIKTISKYYNIPITKIKNTKYYKTLQMAKNIRNTFTHYKINFVCEGLGITDFEIYDNITFKKYFVKSSVKKSIDDILKLCNFITRECKLTINTQSKIIQYGGRDELVGYIFDKKITDLDPSHHL